MNNNYYFIFFNSKSKIIQILFFITINIACILPPLCFFSLPLTLFVIFRGIIYEIKILKSSYTNLYNLYTKINIVFKIWFFIFLSIFVIFISGAFLECFFKTKI